MWTVAGRALTLGGSCWVAMASSRQQSSGRGEERCRRPCQLSEHVSRTWVNFWEPWSGFDFLSMTSLGLLIRVCSRRHLVLGLAEVRGPRRESEQVAWGRGEGVAVSASPRLKKNCM